VTPWESNLGSYWLKETGEDELMSYAKNVCQRSEADFYIGYNYFKEGNLLEAKSHFEQILNNHVYDYVEYKMARFLLTKISIQEPNRVKFRF
jgi:lipoprotein NlpI